MAYEVREGSGSIFENENKTNENARDYTGTAKINGEMYSIACWDKVGKKSGKAYKSIKIEKKEDRLPF